MYMYNIFIITVSEGDDQSIQEQEEKISSYEEAFAKIKDATGVSDIQVTYTMFTSCMIKCTQRKWLIGS